MMRPCGGSVRALKRQPEDPKYKVESAGVCRAVTADRLSNSHLDFIRSSCRSRKGSEVWNSVQRTCAQSALRYRPPDCELHSDSQRTSFSPRTDASGIIAWEICTPCAHDTPSAWDLPGSRDEATCMREVGATHTERPN